ncbi:NADPH:quinone oxidoreductase family protein [Streptomyces spinoverrucosus]|uniref:NADPH:quinone oxidoreductase family protein n=1 Tax=Streptomyces spinoverrucosus TaxID=284043 RepID=UPI0018C41CDE|nr:NADPH:quinone oxidoreductase family protein [Streptomyces spinoverrucosus]MBG0855786.1 NADPH:quinone oxidoreductase family protein [Streptomyces spinoverrucosus]
MRAFQLTEYVGPTGLRLGEIPAPEPGAEGVLVDVRAIGVNFPDLLMTKGLYQYRPELPAVPGCEVAGVVLHSPDGSHWAGGDRVAGFVWHGGFAEQAVLDQKSMVRMPDNVDFASAAAMIVNYHTVHFALARRGQLKVGETVLVMGAGGGIGTAAIQVALGLGASVIAGVADEGQAETARAAGAAEVVVLGEHFAALVSELTGGRGVDAVLDPLGDWLFGEAVRALAPEGRILVIGFAAGRIPEIKVNRLLLRNASVVGVAFGAFLEQDPGLMREQARSLDRMVDEGIVRPQIGARFTFEEIPEALGRLEKGLIPGKGVVLL